MLLSLVLFVITGTYLLVVDPSYAGLGNLFASTWTTLMAVKHVVVIALVAVAVVMDRLISRLPTCRTGSDEAECIRRVRWSAEAATALGAVIVLLTAAAQVSA